MAAHVPQRPGVVRLNPPSAPRRWSHWLSALAWALLLAALPWWLGLPLLLAGALLLWWPALAPHSPAVVRQGLRWGLAGLLLAVLRVSGVDALGWLFTLLAALAGFSLLMLLEGWLDGGRASPIEDAGEAAWPELALAPVGPATAIIELRPPAWRTPEEGLTDPQGGELRWRAGVMTLGDGRRLEGVEARGAVGDDGRWLVLRLADARGAWLLDGRSGHCRRLRGWELAGWHGGEPWLSRGADRMPQPLAHVLGGG